MIESVSIEQEIQDGGQRQLDDVNESLQIPVAVIIIGAETETKKMQFRWVN